MAPSGGSGSGWTGSWIDRWLNQENDSSDPRQLEHEVNQPVKPEPPDLDPSKTSTSRGPVESPTSLYLSAQEFLKQLFGQEDDIVEEEEQPGVLEAMPQAPAPEEERKTSIILRIKELYPNDPWDPEDSCLRENIFLGGNIRNRRPTMIDEMNKILGISHHDKKTYWAKELARRIQNWDWQNPHDTS
ncbi:hypothetical protein Salat_2580600 [Sesamum alatum]|uniref:Uncharacterized protein n=1 Tax=Sesamum alatum TaxID=300844 RepID=A0AAE2CA92_9LAMI|nr:hypothetical protein Salat_2580600 [Sesamum alatum]